jgi:O-methyltransferase domain/Dimerisation domain
MSAMPTATTPRSEQADVHQVMDLIFGRWRSQTLHAGVRLGVFDALDERQPLDAASVAAALRVDPPLLYRLLRALGSLGLVRELQGKSFLLSSKGALLRRDHPGTLRGVTLLEEGPVHYALWQHLPDMIRDGRQNAFEREFGRMAFDYAAEDQAYGEIFNEAMTSYSNAHIAWVSDALAGYDFSGFSQLCDVGGGYGHLATAMLARHPHLRATVLDLPQVVAQRDALWAPRLGVADRCTYVGGDMFESVPPADAYMLKMILHDWNDDECTRILWNAAAAATSPARLFIIEHVVPNADEPHFAKLFDLHMMCWGTGRERSAAEYAALGVQSGWRFERAWTPADGLIQVLEMRLARA